VIRDGALDSFHGHGLADIASHTPVTDGTVFRIASCPDLHGDRRDAAVGTGTGRPRRTGQRLSARLSAASGEGGLAACDRAAPADPHGRRPPDGARVTRADDGLVRRELRARIPTDVPQRPDT
jgi:hypothetical protein